MTPKPWEVTDDDLARGVVPAAPVEDDGQQDAELETGSDFEEVEDPWATDPAPPPTVAPARPTTAAADVDGAEAASGSTEQDFDDKSNAGAEPQSEPEPGSDSEGNGPQDTSKDASEVVTSESAPEEPVGYPSQPRTPGQSTEPEMQPSSPEPASTGDDGFDTDFDDDFWDEPVIPQPAEPVSSGYDLGPSPAPAAPPVPAVSVNAAGTSQPDDSEANTDEDDSMTVVLRRQRVSHTPAKERQFRTSTQARRPLKPSERRSQISTAPVKQRPLARMKKLLAGRTDESRSHETSARRDTIRPLNVVVLGKKGGVGKTVVTALLGMVFASVRKDRVLAVDASPTGGSLSSRCPREGRGTVVSLLDQLEYVSAYAAVREHTAKGDTGLEVLGSDPVRPQRSITGDDYRRLMDELRRHYQLILSDTPGDVTTAPMEGERGILPALLDEADLLVLVTEGADGANAAVWLINWLKKRVCDHDDEHLERLLDDLIVVVSSGSAKSNSKPERMARHFSERIARKVVTLPFDRVIEGGLEIDYDSISPRTRKSMLALADAVTSSDAFTGR